MRVMDDVIQKQLKCIAQDSLPPGIDFEDVVYFLQLLEDRLINLNSMVLFEDNRIVRLFSVDDRYESWVAERHVYTQLRRELLNSISEAWGKMVMDKKSTKATADNRLASAIRRMLNFVTSSFEDSQFDDKQQLHRILQGMEHDPVYRRRVQQSLSGETVDRVQSFGLGMSDKSSKVLADSVIQSALETEKLILDYGCGEGAFVGAMLKSHANSHTHCLHYVGVDNSQQKMAIMEGVKAQFSNRFLKFDLYCTAGNNKNVGLEDLTGKNCICVLRDVLHHIEYSDLPAALRYVLVSAAPKGHIHILEPVTLIDNEPSYIIWDKEDIRDLARLATLTIETLTQLPRGEVHDVMNAILMGPEDPEQFTLEKVESICAEFFINKLKRLKDGMAHIEKQIRDGSAKARDYRQLLDLQRSFCKIAINLKSQDVV